MAGSMDLRRSVFAGWMHGGEWTDGRSAEQRINEWMENERARWMDELSYRWMSGCVEREPWRWCRAGVKRIDWQQTDPSSNPTLAFMFCVIWASHPELIKPPSRRREDCIYLGRRR